MDDRSAAASPNLIAEHLFQDRPQVTVVLGQPIMAAVARSSRPVVQSNVKDLS